MSDANQAFLGVIAAATALMAIMQVVAFVALGRVAKQVRDVIGTLQQDIRPLIARANAIADDASKTAALAAVQAQKIDRLVTELTQRVDDTSAIVQQAIITPAREGMAIVAALKAGLMALKGMRDLRGRANGVEEEDALFIG